MLTELDPKDFITVRDLFAEWHSRLITLAVIEGRTPGWICVDDADHPQTACLWDHAEGELYLSGEARNDAFNRALNDWIRHRIRAEAETRLTDLSEFTVYCDPGRWTPEGAASPLDVVLRDTNTMRHVRKHFTLRSLRVDWRPLVPAGYVMTPLDPALFERDLNGMDVLRDWVLGDWRSSAAFARDERGFCLVHSQDLVGWCASEYTCQIKPSGARACELGIQTSEDYRRQGYATLTAAATVERCLAEDITRIGWHCWDSNLGSAATARKVGFELAAETPVWNACFNALDNLLLQAHYHNQAGHTQQALARWERAFQMWEAQDPEALNSPHLASHPGTVGWCYYAAGCARAQMGAREVALEHLNHALDNGWQDADRLRDDEALAGLRGTEGWEALMRRVAG